MLANYILFLNPRLVLGVSGLFLGSFGRVWLEEGHGRTQGITVCDRTRCDVPWARYVTRVTEMRGYVTERVAVPDHVQDAPYHCLPQRG